MIPDYKTMYASMVCNNIADIAHEVNRILAHKDEYQSVERICGVKWEVVGIIHYRECDLDFKQQLANGNSILQRTHDVPKGLPIEGEPPFTWQQCAVAALQHDKFDKITDWSTESVLDHLERYNGVGYRSKGVYSPYIWSYSNWYQKGKYGSDDKYDPELIDKEVGAACLWKYLTA